MDLLSILGSDLTKDQIAANESMSNGHLFQEIVESNFQYELAESEVIEFIRAPHVCDEIIDYFAFENFEAGMEGFISNLWFRFVQFIKRLLATASTMFQHFFSGINRKKNYLHDIQIKIRGSTPLNWKRFKDSRVKCYDPDTFMKIISVVDSIEKLLKKLFANNTFDIDGISDLSPYGYTFENGYMLKNGKGDIYSPNDFEVPYHTREDKDLGELHWDIHSYGRCLDMLLEHLDFHGEKDYLFIKFKYAMEALIRNKEHETKVDRDLVNRLTQTAKTAMLLMTFITRKINICTAQMVTMGKILETEEESTRPENVEW